MSAPGAVRIHGRAAAAVHRPESRAELAEWLRATTGAVAPVGGGTRLHLGAPLAAESYTAVDLTGLSRIVDHAVDDLTITVEAGVTLAALQERLAAHQQWIPLDPPRPECATVGGLLATAAWGPLRPWGETPRRHLIGLTVLDSAGVARRAGGRVVKNVAGYDMMKLHTGALGTLGIIVEATFRVHPRPEQEVLHLGCASSLDALMDLATRLTRSDLEPAVFVAMDSRHAAELGVTPNRFMPLGIAVGFLGFREDVAWREEQLFEMATEAGVKLEHRLVDADAAGFRARLVLPPLPGATKLRAAALPTQSAALLQPTLVLAAELTGTQSPEMFVMYPSLGQLRVAIPADVTLTAAHLTQVRAAVERMGGHLLVERSPAVSTGEFDPWGSPGDGAPLMAGLKTALDPARRFNPGRFAGGI